MFSIIIPLKHIILDPAKQLDLATIPQQDAIELIRKSYVFLSPAIQVTIADVTATIQMEEARGEKIGDALKQFQKAVREAQQGSYPKAVKLFGKVLEGNPATYRCSPQSGYGLLMYPDDNIHSFLIEPKSRSRHEKTTALHPGVPI